MEPKQPDEKSNFLKTLKDNWVILFFIGTIIIQWAENRKDTASLQQSVASLTETVETLNKVIEEKIAKEANRLDEEDDGVRGDMERADKELHNDLKDMKELEEMRQRASEAEMKNWVYEKMIFDK